MLLKKKRKVNYTFQDYCEKQIKLYEDLIDNEQEAGNKKLFEGMVGRFEVMIAEYKRYNKECELMERKNLSHES